jgi:tRNA(Ile)-lysidine synthase
VNQELASLEINWHHHIPPLMERYRGIVVACSGGVDSTVLFHLLAAFKKKHLDFPLALMHLNYGLRGEASDAAEDFVATLAKDHEVPFFAHKALAPGESSELLPSHHIQSWARKIRYEKFADLAAQGWLIALAHHLDDSAENIILRLARGSSPGSLLGMQEFHNHCWRPLLSLRKSQLIAYADATHLGFCEDESNSTLAYSRNVIRLKVLPELEELYPGAARRIVRCGEHARDFVAAAEEEFPHWILLSQGEGLPCHIFNQLAPGVAYHLLAALIGPLPEQKKRLTFKLLQNILARVTQEPPRRFCEQLPANMGKIRVRDGLLNVERPVLRN